MKKLIIRLNILLLVALFTATTSCSFSKEREIAEQSVAKFHDELNSEKYQEIYQNGDAELRQAQSQAGTLAYFNTIHQKLGDVKSTTQVRWQVMKFSTETIATLWYDTEFAQGKAHELFIFVLSGDKAVLRKYGVNSPLIGHK